jgi:hypothetical protein
MSEIVEHAEHAEHAAHSNRGIALLISVLALILAVSELLGKSAQTEGITHNIQASDTWNFYQARNIRITTVSTAQEIMQIEVEAVTDPAKKAAMTKQVDAWKKRVAQWDSDPERKEGRKELMEKARHLEAQRDLAMERYHNYEFASAALQIGIVLASASIITSMVMLAWISGGLGLVGLAFIGCGLFAPEFLMHLFAAGHAAGAH